mgnify:CR=1 FL=1
MGIAILSSLRSKDPSTQVGACIVNSEKRILSMGYNGMPRCCSDDDFPWDRNGCAVGSVRGCTVYTTLFPCNECAKAIIQSGITEVVYASDKYSDSDSVLASKRMFETAGVKYRLYAPTGKGVTLSL